MYKTINGWLAIIFLLFSVASQADDYQIEKVKGDVYRFVDGTHRSLFVVGKNAILVVDTLNSDAASWLKKALDTRFNLPVRYVVYSHNHSDHIYGADAFVSPHTVFIAQELAKQDIAMTKATTVMPELSFKQQLNVDLGDHIVELRYHGPNDGRGSISVLVQPEKVLFVVDWIVLGRMPWQKLWSYDIQGVLNSTQVVMNLDFDTFVGGHGTVGTKQDVARYLNYMERLYAEVTKATLAGKSLAQMQKEIRLDDFKDLPNYEAWLPLNIEGVHKRLMEESGLGWRPDIP
jgi:glyoxylase-like metal-dependent hydrolase (beta-lactamase superfamily II)